MSLEDIKKPESVLAAVEEYRRLGRDAFLEKYGFRLAREYYLVIDGERFDSKAIVGAAHGYEFPHVGPLHADQFSAGAATVVPKLRKLGFVVERSGDAIPNAEHGPVSAMLTLGSIYTRDNLKKLLDTEDSTINTGIFKPAGYASVLIFITKNKTSDRTQYENRLDGDVLYFQSQIQGRKDSMLVEHRQLDLELLLFYRDSKSEHPGAGFRYEGQFDYVSHDGKSPAAFILRRKSSGLDVAATQAQTEGVFDPSSIEDAREKTLAAIVRRQGQPAFRRALLKAYEGRCAVTGCAIPEVLEAAHIVPYQGPKTNHVSNGLLLRADLHTLFDLGLIAVDERTHSLIVALALEATEYAQWRGKTVRLPVSRSERPSPGALRAHREGAGLTGSSIV